MINFIQPLGTVLIGLAMFAYGGIQTALHHPSASSFQSAAMALPDAIAVIVFGFGVAAVVVGVVLLVSGIRGVRSRTRDISRAYGSGGRPHRRSDEEEWEHEMAYR